MIRIALGNDTTHEMGGRCLPQLRAAEIGLRTGERNRRIGTDVTGAAHIGIYSMRFATSRCSIDPQMPAVALPKAQLTADFVQSIYGACSGFKGKRSSPVGGRPSLTKLGPWRPAQRPGAR